MRCSIVSLWVLHLGHFNRSGPDAPSVAFCFKYPLTGNRRCKILQYNCVSNAVREGVATCGHRSSHFNGPIKADHLCVAQSAIRGVRLSSFLAEVVNALPRVFGARCFGMEDVELLRSLESLPDEPDDVVDARDSVDPNEEAVALLVVDL